MKSLTALALIAALLSSAGLMAQQSTASQPQQQTSASPSTTSTSRHAHRKAEKQHTPDPNKQTENLTKKLDLTADQQKQIEPILAERDKKVADVRANTALSKTDRNTQLRTIRQDTKTKINALLTDAQKQSSPKQRTSEPGKQTENLTKRLNLTADQQKQIEPILAERDKKLADLRANTALASSDRNLQFRAIRLDAQFKINALLTDEQKQMQTDSKTKPAKDKTRRPRRT